MFSLSPAKILVVLIVALLVLGPEKLPRMAHQAGALWNEIRLWRNKLESSVRETFPSLPATHEITSAVRSPVSFLDKLADQHAAAEQTSGDGGDQRAALATEPQAGEHAALSEAEPHSTDQWISGPQAGDPNMN